MVQNVKEEMAKSKDLSSSMLLNPFAAASSMFPPLLDMSSTQTLLAMVRTAKEAELHTLLKNVKRNESSSPLDLSAAAPPTKRARLKTPVPKRAQSESPKPGAATSVPLACTAAGRQNGHHHTPAEDISRWGVEDVCAFVGSIDICAEYVQVSTLLYFLLTTPRSGSLLMPTRRAARRTIITRKELAVTFERHVRSSLRATGVNNFYVM